MAQRRFLSLLVRLSEGWTVFLERKITGRMHGNEFAEFSAILGWKALKDSVNQYGDDEHGFTQLVTKLDDKDPDDAFSSIPYVASFHGHVDDRKKDSICYMRSNLGLVARRFSKRLYLHILAIFDISHCRRQNSRTFSTHGSSRSTGKA